MSMIHVLMITQFACYTHYRSSKTRRSLSRLGGPSSHARRRRGVRGIDLRRGAMAQLLAGEASALDPQPILAALGVTDATATQRISGGWDTAIWRVERPAGTCALRVFPPGRARSCQGELV